MTFPNRSNDSLSQLSSSPFFFLFLFLFWREGRKEFPGCYNSITTPSADSRWIYIWPKSRIAMETISRSYLDISQEPDIWHRGNKPLSFSKWPQLYFVETDPVFSKWKNIYMYGFLWFFSFLLNICWFKFCNFYFVSMWGLLIEVNSKVHKSEECSMNLYMWIHLRNLHLNQEVEYFQHLSGLLHSFAHSVSPTRGNQYSAFYPHRLRFAYTWNFISIKP